MNSTEPETTHEQYLEARLAELRQRFPQLAWKREIVVKVFKSCGLGGVNTYKRWKAAGVLRPMPMLQSCNRTKARYSREVVLDIVQNEMMAARVALK